MFRRQLRLAPEPAESFFLWGPRQAGKTSPLRATYRDASWIDLLKTDEFARHARRPALLREEVLAAPAPGLIVIDEVQKRPTCSGGAPCGTSCSGWCRRRSARSSTSCARSTTATCLGTTSRAARSACCGRT